MLNGRTMQFASYIEGFKGMRTSLHKRLCQQRIFLVELDKREHPEMQTTW